MSEWEGGYYQAIVRSYSNQDRKTSSGQYCEIPIAEHILDYLDLNKGDLIHLEPRRITLDSEETAVINGVKTRVNSRYAYKIKKRDGLPKYAISFPVEWSDYRETMVTDGKRVKNPFYGEIKPGKELVFQIFEEELTIYPNTMLLVNDRIDMDDPKIKFGEIKFSLYPLRYFAYEFPKVVERGETITVKLDGKFPDVFSIQVELLDERIIRKFIYSGSMEEEFVIPEGCGDSITANIIMWEQVFGKDRFELYDSLDLEVQE